MGIAVLCALMALSGSVVNADSLDYDTNGNGVTEKDEALAVVIDYFQDKATKEDALAVIGLYLSPPTAESSPTPLPSLEEAINSLAWVQDGMTLYELSVVQMLEKSVNPANYIEEADTVWELVRHPDMNNIDPDTGQLTGAAGSLAYFLPDIHYRSGNLADPLPRLIDMPFLQSFDELDYIPLRFLEYMLSHGPADVSDDDKIWVLSHPSWEEGLTDEEPLLPLLMFLERKDPVLMAQVAGLSWVMDGIDDSEYYPALRLQKLALESVAVLRAVLDEPWIRDGLDRAESSVVNALSQLSRGAWFHDSSMYEYFTAESIAMLQMPFLDTVEPSDARALWALADLMTFDNTRPSRVLAHPALRNGITDEQTAPVLAAAFLKLNPDRIKNSLDGLLHEFLDPLHTTVEQRMLTLPLAGEVQLMVVRTDNYPHYMHYFEQSVRHHEDFMGVPLPYDSGVLVITEIGGGGWANWVQGGMAIDTAYARAGNNAVRGVIAHEAAHVYWTGWNPWMAEGPAVFLERISQHKDTHESNFKVGVDSCSSAYNIADLYKSRSGLCPYVLGSAFFYDLYHAIGEEAFRQGFRNLYLIPNEETALFSSIVPKGSRAGRNITGEKWYEGVRHEECSLVAGRPWSWCYFKAAFVADQEPEIAANADAVIKLWLTPLAQ